MKTKLYGLRLFLKANSVFASRRFRREAFDWLSGEYLLYAGQKWRCITKEMRNRAIYRLGERYLTRAILTWKGLDFDRIKTLIEITQLSPTSLWILATTFETDLSRDFLYGLYERIYNHSDSEDDDRKIGLAGMKRYSEKITKTPDAQYNPVAA